MTTVWLWVALLGGCGQGPSAPAEAPDAPAASTPAPAWSDVAPTHVGSMVCGECHGEVSKGWKHSEHGEAMELDDDGLEEWPTLAGLRPLLPDPAVLDDVVGVLGEEPLQQYLVRRPGGRMQVLPWGWDTRPSEAGGHRWFALPGSDAAPGDPLYWDGPAYNADHMCLECHTTGFAKTVDPAVGSPASTWVESAVGCEACHGPGARHVAWARAGAEGQPPGDLVVHAGNDRAAWRLDADKHVRTPPAGTGPNPQVDACARCHARRATLTDTVAWEGSLLQTHRPALLEDGLYLPDGQIEDEVYVWGSFVQSAMYRAGVTCTDCHDPHTTQLKRTGVDLCVECHDATTYAVADHSHHAADQATCVDCHMPNKVYMAIDPRRDHGFQVPRPQHAAALGVREPCTTCHDGRDAAWAAKQATGWWGDAPRPRDTWTAALAAGRTAASGAPTQLRAVVVDPAMPGIVRATAASLLARWPGPATAEALTRAAHDPDPVVRLGAVAGAIALNGRVAGQVLGPLLHDPVRAVRQEAARTFAATGATSTVVPDNDRGDLQGWVDSQQRDLDRPEALINLGAFEASQGQIGKGAQRFARALGIAPWSVEARANLADLLRQQGDDARAGALLAEGLTRDPDATPLWMAQGLAKVRAGDKAGALVDLERGVQETPDDANAVFLLAIALDDAGRTGDAVARLLAARARMPADPRVLQALTSFAAKDGQRDLAVDAAQAWVDLDPSDPGPKKALLSAMSTP